MTREDALRDLIAKVDAGDRINYDDTDPVSSNLFKGCTLEQAGMFNKACQCESLDAALALHDAVLPKWGWANDYDGEATVWQNNGPGTAVIQFSEQGPARAWLLCILRALLAQEEG